MDINQNQQINTFTKGMNTDTSDALVSNELYRYAENVRPITDTDSNSGELYLIEGTLITDILDGIDYDDIIAVDSIRNYMVFILAKKRPKTTALNRNHFRVKDTIYWAIYKSIDGGKAQCVFDWSDHDMFGVEYDEGREEIDGENSTVYIGIKNTYKLKTISTVLRWESDKNIKLYIANGIDPLLSINVYYDISEKYKDKSFDDVFGYLTVPLAPLETSIAGITGYITAGIVQYAYRAYALNGAATKLSPLSKPLSLYKSNIEGYPSKMKSGRAVRIIYPTIKSSELDYIQIYRINFVESGQRPTINLIRDEKINTTETIDTGVGDIQELSAAEFLSMIDADITPAIIESKNDYLFAANLDYTHDNSDDEFADFDARAYSKGNYIIVDGKKKRFYGTGDDVATISNSDFNGNILRHEAFTDENGSATNLDGVYNSAHWEVIEDGWNGIGKNVKWRYTYSDYYELTPDKQADTYLDSHRSFRRGEVYRFGIRLFNQTGVPSSVKWIADIMMPPLEVKNGEDVAQEAINGEQYYSLKVDGDICYYNGAPVVRDLGIQFYVNTPDNCSGYEIVRCNRTINDKYTITQGLAGFPLELKITTEDEEDYELHTKTDNLNNIVFKGTNLICPSGFMSQNKFKLFSVYHDKTGTNVYALPLGWVLYNKVSDNASNVLMFASPEYVYQPDDVEQLLKQYEPLLRIQRTAAYIPNSTWRSGYLRSIFYAEPRTADDFDTNMVLSKQTANEGMPYGLEVSNNYYDQLKSADGKLDDFYVSSNYTFFMNSDYEYSKYGNTDFTDRGAVVEEKDERTSCVFFNYITPHSVYNIATKENSISNISFAKSPEYSDFADAEHIKFLDSVTTIKDKLFINWSTPLMLKMSSERKRLAESVFKIDHGSWWNETGATGVADRGTKAVSHAAYPIGAGGSCILLHLNEERLPIDVPTTTSGDTKTTYMPQIVVENLKKPAAPYNGYSYASFSRSDYYSYGNYGKTDTINVFNGDCRIRIFTYNAAHVFYNTTFWQFPRMGTTYAVPIESDVDIQGQHGVLYGVNTTDYHVQDKAAIFGDYTQEKDAYLYNTAYNIEPDIIGYSADVKTAAETDMFDTRVQYSEVKTNNEMIDSWLLFKAMNFLDVDSRFGEITDLKLFKDKLIFWQNNATGILSVNERVILNDVNDTQIVLGTGSVLERYDYFTTVYGQKPNQHARAVSNNALYWWDGFNKEILQYAGGAEVIPLSTIKTVSNYINQRDETEVPTLVYDPKFKEVICNVVHGDIKGINNGSIVYNEQIQAFSSVYTFSPIFSALINDTLYLTDNESVYKYNINGTSATLFGVDAHPLVQYVVNANSTTPKTFDIQTFGGRFYGGSEEEKPRTDYRMPEHNNNPLGVLNFKYKTPLKQESNAKGNDIVTNREYDYRLTIPRNGSKDLKKEWGDRMRGKTMQCELKSGSNSRDFSLQYVITKFRMSWI